MSKRPVVDDKALYTYEYFLQPDICRLCWCKNADREISDISKITKESFELLDKIKYCLNLDLYDNSCYPKNTCASCYDNIEKFHEFKTLCRDRDKKLRDIFRSKLKKEHRMKAPVKVEKIDDILNDLEIMVSSVLQSDEADLTDYQPSENEIEPEIKKSVIIKKKKYVPKRSNTYCNICRIDFASVDKMHQHNLESHGIEDESSVFKCFGCERRFKSRKTRLGHEINFCKGLKDGYKCSLCGRFLPKRRMYEAHMRDHRHNPDISIELPEEIFKCTKCMQSFKTKEDLKMHRDIQEECANKRNFICETCGKIFTRRDYLYKHKLTHTGTKQYVCPHCGFRTTQKSSLTVHIRKHTGERPFGCDMCPQRCISSSNLRAHRQRHLGFKNYECKLCDKKFGYKMSLEEHVSATHERGTGHQCELCGSVYSRVRGLRRHLLTKHGKQSVKIRRINNSQQDVYLKMMTENEPNVDCKKDGDVKVVVNEKIEVILDNSEIM